MIKIDSKEKCCGCWACVQRCPKHCITMVEDDEGFLYPKVDSSLCIDCSLCEKVCPVINQGEPRIPDVVYAAKNLNEEIRMASSSGGIFTLLAEEVIAKGGVVFGARFNPLTMFLRVLTAKGGVVFGARFNEEWDVVHDYTETIEGLSAFRGSKYVQSRVGKCYSQVEEFLKKGRKVLFSGTPCQIAGLKRFLRKEYDNLLTVDFICHGVPSPGIWREYLKEETTRQCGGKNTVLSHPVLNGRDARIESISFRNKRLGWKKYSFALTFSVSDGHGEKNTVLLSEPLNKNIFLRGFIADLYLRPSCHACPAKSLKSGSDITIGDFWGIQNVMPEIDDDKGVSVVMVSTEKGKEIWREIATINNEVTFDDVVAANPALIRSVNLNRYRNKFYRNSMNTIEMRVASLTSISFCQRCRGLLSAILLRLGLLDRLKGKLKKIS